VFWGRAAAVGAGAGRKPVRGCRSSSDSASQDRPGAPSSPTCAQYMSLAMATARWQENALPHIMHLAIFRKVPASSFLTTVRNHNSRLRSALALLCHGHAGTVAADAGRLHRAELTRGSESALETLQVDCSETRSSTHRQICLLSKYCCRVCRRFTLSSVHTLSFCSFDQSESLLAPWSKCEAPARGAAY